MCAKKLIPQYNHLTKMNYKRIELGLTQIVFQNLIELNLKYSKRNNKEPGTLYTYYRKYDRSIKIGFTKYFQETNKKLESLGYELLRNRPGSKREEKILTATLVELGYEPIYNRNYYCYSEIFLKHLKTLGWPTNEPSLKGEYHQKIKTPKRKHKKY